MLPNFLIIGAPRAGTSWLARNVREHPDIFMPSTKELHYFDRHHERGPSYYESFFEGAEGATAVGEATPDYLHLPDVPERIWNLVPEAKLIVSLRNPVDRVYSRYWNSRAKFEENRRLSFEQKLRRKPEFIEEGFYHTNVMRYLEYFPLDRFHFVLYEDIATDPIALLSSVFRFLDVQDDFVPASIEHRVNAAADKPYLARSRSVYFLHKALSRVGLETVARRLADWNIADLPEMNEATRRWLSEEVYRGEVESLERLCGLDLDRWSISGTG